MSTIIRDDHPPFRYQVTPPIVVDKEGFPVPSANLKFSVSSDNTSALTVAPDGPLTGTITVIGPEASGGPNSCNIVVDVEDENGDDLGSFGAAFTVVASAAASAKGGSIAFSGLDDGSVSTSTTSAPATSAPAPASAESSPSNTSPSSGTSGTSGSGS